ncbi:hypothetical protein [Sphingomonas sp. URHD0057]|uniref:hypothetical protein n=1 Tax=Sphingomonas sp. URHD0057 TaxID=1380389 RepID=UPI00048BD17C|nr:hypothetical protein [Sphingomonas sp. URHD0057]
MTLLRLLNVQGIAGITASLCLAVLFILQKGETRHWRKQSGHFEQLYQHEQSAFAGTVANYRAAAARTEDADRATAERVRAEQAAINQRSNNAFETRLADARARAERLRLEAPTAAANPSARGGSAVPGVPAAFGKLASAAAEDRLPASEALTATEQAIQLDELIKWVRQQHEVDSNQP